MSESARQGREQSLATQPMERTTDERPATSRTSAPRPSPVAPRVPSPGPRSSVSAPGYTSPRGAVPRARSSRVRKARLRLSRVDPWSVMKTAFLFAIAGGIMFWVATYVTWAVVESSNLFESINKTVGDIINSDEGGEVFRIQKYVSPNKVLGLAATIAVINVVLSTALATLGSFLYNLSAGLLGGIEVTLAED